MTKEIGLNFFIWTGQRPRRFVTSRFEGEFSACPSYIVALSIKTIKTDAAEPDLSSSSSHLTVTLHLLYTDTSALLPEVQL